jgi:hypothetical protein
MDRLVTMEHCIRLDRVLLVSIVVFLLEFKMNVILYQDGLWSVMTLGMAASSGSEGTTTPGDPAFEFRNRLLSNQSIHLLLILSNHFTNDAHRNPYRLALLHFTDTQGQLLN